VEHQGGFGSMKIKIPDHQQQSTQQLRRQKLRAKKVYHLALPPMQKIGLGVVDNLGPLVELPSQ
jgi:hypothetical protein